MYTLGLAGLITFPVLGSDAEDVTITAAGSYDFQPATNPHGSLVNQVSDGKVTLTQTDNPQDKDHAVTFTSFDAVGSAETEFSGGWWDFGATDAATINFFTDASSASDRLTTLTGAVVTNVGTACVAGSSGTDNTLALKSGSSFTASELRLGAKADRQRSKVTVEGASALNCLSHLWLSYGQVSSAEDALYKTGNELTVSGAGSSLTVGGTTYVGASSDVIGKHSGNTLKVTDGARASLQSLAVATGTRHGQCNKIVFGKDARVDMTAFYVCSDGYYSYPPASNTIEVVDGAVVTDAGKFLYGGDNASRGANTLLVSNATFSVAECYVVNGVNYFLCGPNSTFTLSGADAQFSSTKGIGAFFRGSNCTFVVENDATYTFPSQGFSYTVATEDETMIVRSGATVTVPGGFGPRKSASGSKDGESKRNRIVVEDGATLKCDSGQIMINGIENSLVVSNGTVAAYGNSFGIGTVDTTDKNYTATNCLLHIAGTRPSAYGSWSFYIRKCSTLRIDLPADGYDEGYATSAKPIIGCGKSVNISDDSTVTLTGAEAMLKRQAELGKRLSEYVLFRAGSGLTLPDGLVDSLQAKLPKGMTLSTRTVSGSTELVLTVKVKFGTAIVLR